MRVYVGETSVSIGTWAFPSRLGALRGVSFSAPANPRERQFRKKKRLFFRYDRNPALSEPLEAHAELAQSASAMAEASRRRAVTSIGLL